MERVNLADPRHSYKATQNSRQNVFIRPVPEVTVVLTRSYNSLDNFVMIRHDMCINAMVIKEGESGESSARRPKAPEEALIHRATLD